MWHNINIGKKKSGKHRGKMDCFPSSIIPHLSSNYNSWYGLYHKKKHTNLHLLASFFPKLFFPLWVKVICSKDSFEGFGFITKIPVLLSTFLLLMVSEWGKGIHSTYLGHSSSLLTLSISLLRHENHFLKDCRLLSECYTDDSSL